MKYHKSSQLFLRVCGVSILFIAVFIIHSCKKDSKPAAIADPVISQAKEWYEATYSTTPTVRFAIKVNGSTRSSGNSRFDYSKHIKPDWQHGAKYSRYNSNVIELPLDPSSDKINSGFKNMSTGKTIYQSKYSRSSFLLLHDGTGYRAYVMTIIGDSAYVNNDPGKLALTTYRKRDPNFSGMVAYFTPDGKFVASYGYKNGKLIPAALPSTASSAAANTKSTARFHPTARKLAVTNCIDWYMCYFENDVIVEADYLYTTCDVADDGSGSPAAGGTSPAPAPVPCPAQSVPAGAITPHSPITIRVVQNVPPPTGGDDGGLPPPPPTQTTETCPVPVPPPPPDSLNVVFCTGLTSSQITSIQNTIGAFKSLNCPANYLYSYFSGQTFSFCIDSTAIGNVNYNPQNNSFTFATDYAATPTFAYLLEHEFFHAYQNAIYPGGITPYGMNATTGVASAGFVNIEFEQAVFNDISTGDKQAFINGTADQQKQYSDWINGLTANGTIYPKLSPTSADYTQFINNYNSFLSQYNNIPGNPNNSSIISLSPNALINLFNNTNPNC